MDRELGFAKPPEYMKAGVNSPLILRARCFKQLNFLSHDIYGILEAN